MKIRSQIRQANLRLNDRFWPRGTVGFLDRYYHRAAEFAAGTQWVLNLGAGTQDIAQQFDRGPDSPRVLNIDIELKDLIKNPSNLRICANAEALPIKAETIDLICARLVFEHIADPGRVLAECFRVLKKGGHLLIVGPNGWSYIAAVARLTPLKFHNMILRTTLDAETGIHGFHTYYRFNSLRAMRGLSKKAGFELVSFERFVGAPCYTISFPLVHAVAVAYHLLLEQLKPKVGCHITSVAAFRKPLWS